MRFRSGRSSSRSTCTTCSIFRCTGISRTRSTSWKCPTSRSSPPSAKKARSAWSKSAPDLPVPAKPALTAVAASPQVAAFAAATSARTSCGASGATGGSSSKRPVSGTSDPRTAFSAASFCSTRASTSRPACTARGCATDCSWSRTRGTSW
uniref:(northern house mosquito) hypothetical protein n=1 Tax=Culex pipiens TaxID=7175 RepID=A0A8D8APA7_CULPI